MVKKQSCDEQCGKLAFVGSCISNIMSLDALQLAHDSLKNIYDSCITYVACVGGDDDNFYWNTLPPAIISLDMLHNALESKCPDE